MPGLWSWIASNKTLAATIALLSIIVVGSATAGLSARRAARQYFDLAKGWAEAYQRDTTASREEYEAKIKALSTERDVYLKRWEEARKKMETPWVPPKGAKALQDRFNKLGYRGALR